MRSRPGGDASVAPDATTYVLVTYVQEKLAQKPVIWAKLVINTVKHIEATEFVRV